MTMYTYVGADDDKHIRWGDCYPPVTNLQQTDDKKEMTKL